MLSVSPGGSGNFALQYDPINDVLVNDLGEQIGFDPIPLETLDLVSDEIGAAPLPDEGELPASPSTASFDLADTFLLHSNPTATKTIYLDFDGHTTNDPSWNLGEEIVTPRFNFEGYDLTFTDGEYIRIQEIWEQVAEDFIPFDVDVTTEEPPLDWLEKDYTDPTDERWGVRVVLGGSSGWTGSGYYGLAHYNSFGNNRDTPAFVFTGGTGSGVSKVATIASHEIGHAVGLHHDGSGSEYYGGYGSGETSWGPIMGNAWEQSLSQWSKGEYNNASNTEDDLTIITTASFNQIGYRVDDHGNDAISASLLDINPDAQVFDAGIIEQTTDVDYFTFTTMAGTVNLNIDGFYRGANLDVLATLYDSSLQLVATSNPDDFIDASFSETLAAGTYYLTVEGTGKPAPNAYSDYASLGQYTITGNIITPGVVVAESDGDTFVSEGETIDTYDVSLVTVPAGSVEITATAADGQIELSLDGVIFSSSVVFSRSDQTPQTITIRAINDTDADVTDTSMITHAITATADPTDYPTSFEIFDLDLDVLDDDVPHIIDDDDTEPRFAHTNFVYQPSPYHTGYEIDYHTRDVDTGPGEATWTLKGVSDGNYRISTTWKDRPNRAPDAPYTIVNDAGVVLAFKTINQQIAPDDFADAGGNWEDLAIVSATDGTLVVKLNGSPEELGIVVADAVRIERIGDVADLMTLEISHSEISENGGATTGTVMRTGDMVGNLTVTLSSDDTSEATVPASVVILDGQATATFAITAVDDPYIDSTNAVNVTASATGFANAVHSVDVTDDEPDPPATIIDDGDLEFTADVSYAYNDTTSLGYADDHHQKTKNTGLGDAVWTFTGLAPGDYQVAATWAYGYNLAPDAPYSVEDGGGTVLATAALDQTIKPDDFTEDDTKWEEVSVVTVTDGTLVVKLGGSTSGHSYADAIRVDMVAEAIPLGLPPTVTDVIVSSTAWTTHFLDTLDAQGMGHASIPQLGYAVPVGDGATQLASLPWMNLNQIRIVFDAYVIVVEDDLVITGANVPSYSFAPGSFSFDPITYVATWTLDSSVADDRLTITLESDATAGVHAAGAVALDGEWDNPTDRFDVSSDTFASGDGSAGGDFVFNVEVLPGDVDQDGDVDVGDILGGFGGFTGPQPVTPTYTRVFSDGDLNGDADVDVTDIFTMFSSFTGPLDSSMVFLAGAMAHQAAGTSTSTSADDEPFVGPVQARTANEDTASVIAADREERESASATDMAFAQLGAGDLDDDDTDDELVTPLMDPLALSVDASTRRSGRRR